MKIGLDLRLTENSNIFSEFLIELTKEIIKNNKENIFTIYCNNSEVFQSSEKIIVKKVNIKNGSFKEQTNFYSILKKDKNDLVVFFDHNKPIAYRKHFVLFINSLENIYYQNFDKFLTKHKYLFLLKNAIKKAEKIICFENNTIDELAERFNIASKKVSILNGFFPGTDYEAKNDFIKMDIKTRYNLQNDFFIYSSGIGIHKNIERLLAAIKRLKDLGKKISLVFLGNNISNQIYIREAIIKYELQSEVSFLGEIKNEEKRNLYLESLGVILPSFYEPFPFSLNDSIKFNTPIIAGNLENTKKIFENNITYFSPISTSDLEKTLVSFLEEKTNKEDIMDYSSVLKRYNKENTAKDFLKIIV